MPKFGDGLMRGGALRLPTGLPVGGQIGRPPRVPPTPPTPRPGPAWMTPYRTAIDAWRDTRPERTPEMDQAGYQALLDPWRALRPDKMDFMPPHVRPTRPMPTGPGGQPGGQPGGPGNGGNLGGGPGGGFPPRTNMPGGGTFHFPSAWGSYGYGGGRQGVKRPSGWSGGRFPDRTPTTPPTTPPPTTPPTGGQIGGDLSQARIPGGQGLGNMFPKYTQDWWFGRNPDLFGSYT